MRPSKIYLDTSVINFLFADDAPQYRDDTLMFFENAIKPGLIQCYVSEYVVQELNSTIDDGKREKLLNVLSDYPIEFLEINSGEVEILSNLYINAGVIPAKKIYDAYHLAVATLSEMNFVVSWNFKHLANIHKEKRVLAVNALNDYWADFRIITPLEVINYDYE